MSDSGSLVEIRRVLVMRLRWLGDVVMSTPMIEALREALPEARIEYLTYSSFAAAVENHPALDATHTLAPKAGVRESLTCAWQLRRPQIDWCFDTLANPRSLALLSLMRPRHSAGPDRGFRSRLLEHRLPHDHGVRSAVRHYLDSLTPALGWVDERPPAIYVPSTQVDFAARRFELETGAPLIVLHPGATRQDKVWPVERWPRLIAGLQRSLGKVPIKLVTQPGFEAQTGAIVEASSGDVQALPALDLRELLALLANATLYVGNDGGILHCAVALQVPTVGILGPTEDDVWFPYSRWGPYRIVRRESGTSRREDDQTIENFPDAGVEEVLTAVDDVLEIRRSEP
jgi:ADP-heptose:LPS heptosyltransferase